MENEQYLDMVMGQFTGAPKHRIMTQEQLDATEWSEQSRFAKWLKKEYPDLLFYCDISSGAKKSGVMQGVSSILKSDDAYPDIFIFKRVGNYVGLMLEMKRVNSGTFLKDGSLSGSKHVQDQHRCHEKLRLEGWCVHFVEGAERGKEIFLNYIKSI